MNLAHTLGVVYFYAYLPIISQQIIQNKTSNIEDFKFTRFVCNYGEYLNYFCIIFYCIFPKMDFKYGYKISRTPDQDFCLFYPYEIIPSHIPIPVLGNDKKRTVARHIVQ